MKEGKDMKKSLVLLILLVLCACSSKKEETIDLKGFWIIDEAKTDINALNADMDKYPGFNEWGAHMEIAEKQISFFIGALSYEVEYLQNNNQIITDVKNLNDENLNEFNFEIIVENNQTVLKMKLNDIDLYWIKEDINKNN